MTVARKAKAFWPVLLVVFFTDCTTKRVAVESLGSAGSSHEVLGETVRFTLVYNEGSAMGLVGPWAKKPLGIASLLAVLFLFGWYRKAPPKAAAFGAATGLVIAGALGNGWQRLWSPGGVVDFVDVGIGAQRFWVFNVADVAVNVGAVLLLLALLRSENESSQRQAGCGRPGRSGHDFS